MQDFSFITAWVDNSLRAIMPGWLAVTTECVLVGVGLLLVYALLALFYIYYERKLCAAFQCRLGPNRVGPWGLLQSFADMFKMLIKEIIELKHIDRFLFALAPYLVIIASMLAFAVLPWGRGLQVINFNIGIFFLMAVSSIGVLGILLAGWSSNNKYTLIGSLRSGAQMVSYELSIGLSIITMTCLAGSMSVEDIVMEQENLWFIFSGHIPAIIAFVIYMIAGTARPTAARSTSPRPRASSPQATTPNIPACTSASSTLPNTSTSSSCRAWLRSCSSAAGCLSTSPVGMPSTTSWTTSPAWYGSWARHSSSPS